MKICSSAYGLPADYTGALPTTPPTILSVTPNHGSAAGGDTIVIAGAGFTGAVLVEFLFDGTHPSLAFVVDSDSQITADTPAELAGRVYGVRVSRPDGLAELANAYTFDGSGPPPAGFTGQLGGSLSFLGNIEAGVV